MEDKNNGELLSIRISVKRNGRLGRPTSEEYNSRFRDIVKTKNGERVEIDVDPGFDIQTVRRFVESLDNKEVSELRKQMMNYKRKATGRHIGKIAPGPARERRTLNFETTEDNKEKKRVVEEGRRK